MFNPMRLFSVCARYRVFTVFSNHVFSMMPLFVLLCLLIRQMKYRLILICIVELKICVQNLLGTKSEIQPAFWGPLNIWNPKLYR